MAAGGKALSSAELETPSVGIVIPSTASGIIGSMTRWSFSIVVGPPRKLFLFKSLGYSSRDSGVNFLVLSYSKCQVFISLGTGAKIKVPSRYTNESASSALSEPINVAFYPRAIGFTATIATRFKWRRAKQTFSIIRFNTICQTRRKR